MSRWPNFQNWFMGPFPTPLFGSWAIYFHSGIIWKHLDDILIYSVTPTFSEFKEPKTAMSPKKQMFILFQAIKDSWDVWLHVSQKLFDIVIYVPLHMWYPLPRHKKKQPLIHLSHCRSSRPPSCCWSTGPTCSFAKLNESQAAGSDLQHGKSRAPGSQKFQLR